MNEMNAAIAAASATAVGFAKGFVEGAIESGMTREVAIEMARAWLMCAEADLDDYVAKLESEE